MGVLAHYLEDAGIATTLISLIKENSEVIRPPRTLWVPFELGRPLGAPNDIPFQTRVLRAALDLLQDPGPGPVHIDFPDEAPQSQPDPNWRPPVDVNHHLTAWKNSDDPATILQSEISDLSSAHARFVARAGKSTVGNSGLQVAAAAAFLAAYKMDTPQQSLVDNMSPILLARFCADDIKSYYLEAVASGEGRPNSKQMTDWLWDETAMGAQLRHLRRQALDHGDKRERVVLGRFAVAAARGKIDDDQLL